MLRGLPNKMGSTGITYGAQPNVLGQLGGLGIAAYGGASGRGTR